MWSRARVWLLVLCAAGTFGCSPVARLRLRVVLPGSGTIDPSRLHVSGSKSCPPGPLRAPPPASAPGDIAHLELRAEGPRALELTAAFRGSECSVQLTAWLDSDGSGSVNRGDRLATGPVVIVRDRGVLRGNLTRGADLALAPVPRVSPP